MTDNAEKEEKSNELPKEINRKQIANCDPTTNINPAQDN